MEQKKTMSYAHRVRPSLALIVAFMLFATPSASGGTVSGLTVFSNGTTADAGEVNTNFAIIQAAVNDNDSRIGTLESASAPAPMFVGGLGITPSNGGTLFGIYGQSGGTGEQFSSIVIPRNGTLRNFIVRPDTAVSAGAQVTVSLRINGVTVGTPQVFVPGDGTTAKTDAVLNLAVNAGDLMAFMFVEDNGVANSGRMHAGVIVE